MMLNVLYLLCVCRIYYFSQQIFCVKLTRTCLAYIEAVFGQILSQVGGEKTSGLASFLESPSADMFDLLARRLQCSEELIFYAVLGWIDYKEEERRPLSDRLISCLDFRLFSQAGLDSALEDPALQDFPLSDRLSAAQAYRALSLERKISWWSSRPRSPRWPEFLVVAGCSGSSQPALLSCHLSKFSSGPQWRSLTRKPPELRRRSSGSSLVYSPPRLYFLGGEKHWSLAWYDLELNKWGQEPGLPPPRLLSGVCEVGGSLYLVGGVTLEQWEGVRGGAGSVSPSPCLDIYNLASRTWSQAAVMEVARSSPGVVAVRGKVWVFGGLRRRQVVTSCCCYHPQTDSWTNISDLPEKIAYFSLVSAGQQVWILGGFGQDYTARQTSYCYDTETGQYTRGPSLNSARKGAFSFIHDNHIYVCGGSVDGMNFLNTIEVMNLTSRDGWKEQKMNMNHFNTNMMSVTALLPVRFL